MEKKCLDPVPGAELAALPDRRHSSALALLGGHHVDIARHKGDLLAPALGALRFHGFMLGDGLGAFKLLPAFLATILVGWHGLESSNEGGASAMQNSTPRG